ncbi:MAG: hypothetical protein R3B84_16995 [Zavarzinella sp.]
MYDPDETPEVPTLSAEAFERIQTALSERGTAAAASQLAIELQEMGDLNALFYSHLLEKRVALGVSPFPAGPAAELPEAVHEEYEMAIRQAARTVGAQYLANHDIRSAWTFFNMLGEQEPVKEYLERLELTDADDPSPIIDVALYQGAYPEKGFDVVVQRYGICNAITTYSNQDFSQQPWVKQHAIRTLVRELHAQLLERLRADAKERQLEAPEPAGIPELIASFPQIFGEDAYHIDTSHLSSICQFSLDLEPCSERQLARELCMYGETLSEGFRYPNDPPFENTYHDYRILLQVVDGIDVEAGLQHFAAKIEPGLADGNSLPAEVYVNLLLRLNRDQEALESAKKYLSGQNRPLSCPSVYELCQRAGDYAGMAEAARQRGDGVTFLAALITANQSK